MNHEPDYYVEEPPPRSMSRAIAGGSWTVLRHVLYMFLMLVRVPLRILAHVLFLPLVGLGVFWGFAMGWHSPAFLWMVGSGIGLYVLSFLFDTLLLWVSPEQLYLET
jgi:hypothetical protein